MQHVAKFVKADLNPEQKKEIDGLKLSLNLNLAMCWLKLPEEKTYLDRVLKYCDEALDIDDESVKALLPRSSSP